MSHRYPFIKEDDRASYYSIATKSKRSRKEVPSCARTRCDGERGRPEHQNMKKMNMCITLVQ